MSNRQLYIVGCFALACCTIVALVVRTKPLTRDEVPPIPSASSVGRYQMVSVSQVEGSNVVVLDTTTGQAWLLRTRADVKDPEQWKSLGSPMVNSSILGTTSVRVPQPI